MVIAGLGGLAVLIGLAMEFSAEKDWFKNMQAFRRCKSIRFWGKLLVMAGILIEICVAPKTAIDEWENNPQNQPIASISAKIEFFVLGTNSPTIPLWGQLAVGTPESEKRGTHTLFPIFDSDFKWVTFKDSKTLWFMQCEEMPLTDSFSGELVRDADNWTVFELQVPFLAARTEITGGKIGLNINSILKTNVIPPQMIKSLKYFHEVDLRDPSEGVMVFGQ